MIPTVDQQRTPIVVKFTLYSLPCFSTFVYSAPFVWCNQIVVKPNLLPHKRNNTYFLNNVIPFKVVCLGPYTVNPMTTPPLKVFHEVHCLKLGQCSHQLCMGHGDIKSPSLYCHLDIWE